jgi:hypothetical protein
MELFPDFTDHGPDHLRDVLGLATELITTETYERLGPEDVATLVVAVLLHDLAMHITSSGFTELCSGRTPHRPIEPFDSESWPELWSQFRLSARRWSDQDNYSIFGTTDPGLPPDLHQTDWSNMHRRFAGEFIRRHHARLAHEIALYGFPNAGSALGCLTLDDGIEHLADLAGLVGRSHGMDLRHCVDYLKVKYDNTTQPHRVHAVYLMALLRVADFLQYNPERAPKTRLRVQSLRSPLSNLEWKKHIVHVSGGDDPETFYVFAEPPDVQTYLGLQSILLGLQRELDHAWAVIGEVYRSNQFSLTRRRVRSNLSSGTFRPRAGYLPVHARFETQDAKVLSLLIGPMYEYQPNYGIRELLQNAVDAVRELKAAGGYRGPLVLGGADVLVSLRSDALIVCDCGVGMTSDTVINYFLKAGASFRDSPMWSAAFEDESGNAKVLRSGRFGIGALAAFLIGPTIHVTTRHWSQSRGQRFEANVSTDPIELVLCDCPIGTTVSIPITEEMHQKLRRANLASFVLDWPKVKSNGFDSPERPYVLSSTPENNRPDWVSVRVRDDLFLEWHRSSHEGGTYVNGFAIQEQKEFSKESAFKVPWGPTVTCSASWQDFGARLPLNLKRTELPEMTASDDLAGSFAENWIAWLLVKGSPPGVPESDPLRPNPFPLFIAFADDGFLFPDNELIRIIRPRSVLVSELLATCLIGSEHWPHNECPLDARKDSFAVPPSEGFRRLCFLARQSSSRASRASRVLEFYPPHPLPKLEETWLTAHWLNTVGKQNIPYDVAQRRIYCARAFELLAEGVKYWEGYQEGRKSRWSVMLK